MLLAHEIEQRAELRLADPSAGDRFFMTGNALSILSNRIGNVFDLRGQATTFALLNLQERGTLFSAPGDEVYEGMIVGENPRSEDMDVNPTKEKKQTNMRASTAEELVRLIPARDLSLEQALEFIRGDECVEVTPTRVRLRKVLLGQNEWTKAGRVARARG